MSTQNVKKVSARLELVKREILWAIGALEDADSLLEEYKLSQREKEKLLRQFHKELSSIEAILTQALSVQSQAKRIHIVTEQEIDMTEEEVAEAFDVRIKIDRLQPDSQQIVGEIPPYEDKD